MYPFNVRVYGILINEHDQVLISDETIMSSGKLVHDNPVTAKKNTDSNENIERVSFTKFPGGGLEYGEGLIDALKREYMEECDLQIEIVQHIYTTDFWEKSSFNDSQIISVYYLVKATSTLNVTIKKEVFDFDSASADDKDQKLQAFRLVEIDKLQIEDLTFKTDQVAWQEFLKHQN